MSAVQAAFIECARVGLARRHWSQSQLAKETGLSEKHVSQLLTGKVQGTLDVWDRIFSTLRADSIVIQLHHESER